MTDTPRITFRVTRTAEVTWTGPITSGAGVVDVPSGVMAGAEITFATRTGEPEGHTSPEELIASAHAGCFAMSLVAVLDSLEIDHQSVTVSAALTLGRVDGLSRLIGADLEIHIAGSSSSAGALESAIQTADERCPVSYALRATMPVGITRRTTAIA
ncbi:MAG: OsmC family peroxiredoxin [Microbacteriaceae bacterium]